VKPLEDIRVIAVEQYGAGPFGSLQLADLGADIIKIEDPHVGGDVGRYVPPYQEQSSSLFFETFNRNKRSMDLDLSTSAGQAVLHDLVRVSDAVYSNLRGDIPERLGLCYSQLANINPRIVCCSLSGFGMTGPRRAEPAYDYILQGLAGWMNLTGEPDGPPTKTGLSLVDYFGGMTAALSIVTGVHSARRDGHGFDCDLSLFDVAISLLTYLATWHLTRDYEPARTRQSAHPSLVPFQNFRTADGWIVVGCAKEKFWHRLVMAIGRPELAADERYADFAARRANAAALLATLESTFSAMPSSHWLSLLGAAGVPSGPISTIANALKDPHTLARDLIVQTTHPLLGDVRTVASGARVGSRISDHRRAPLRNEHARDILTTLLAYDHDHIQELTAAGAFGASGRSHDGDG
jgi:crotonobetainyl-CoA:carnitine CoA-transferase CaiB-like acyl-CoA transferase